MRLQSFEELWGVRDPVPHIKISVFQYRPYSLRPLDRCLDAVGGGEVHVQVVLDGSCHLWMATSEVVRDSPDDTDGVEGRAAIPERQPIHLEHAEPVTSLCLGKELPRQTRPQFP